MTIKLELVIEPETLATLLPDERLLIVDLSRPQIYRQAHIPGAIHLDFKKTQRSDMPVGILPDRPQLEALLSEIGLRPDLHVVAYDDEGGGWAGRFLWLLESVGHKHYSYLNGGIHAWLAADLSYQVEANIPPHSDYHITAINADTHVDVAYLLDHYQDSDHVIWDARSETEYLGVQAFARKGGHIPNAKHYEWTDALENNDTTRLKEKARLEQELQQRGIDKTKRVIVHCHTHHRSGLSWLVGKYLGFPDIRAYAGSWSEWGNHPQTPVKTVQGIMV